jgi:hypothetical protein
MRTIEILNLIACAAIISLFIVIIGPIIGE